MLRNVRRLDIARTWRMRSPNFIASARSHERKSPSATRAAPQQ
jgi:hypothetical protein